MSYHQAIKDYAARQGWTEPLKPSQYRQAALAVRPAKEAVRAVASAVESRAATTLRLRVVPDHVAERNQVICESCPDGMFDILKGNQPVCTKCDCSGKWLKSKWKDPKHHCPLGHWDNRRPPEAVW